MNQLANATLPALPPEWINRLWMRMHLMYGNKFADMWRGLNIADVKHAWGEDLAGYTGDELKRGIGWCKTQTWPPTLPEFMTACRPVIDAKTEWAEACDQMRVRLIGQGGDVWGRPEVYWAAVSIGMYDLNSTPWDGIKARWVNALAKAKSDPIPAYLAALPAPGQQTVTREDAVDRLNEIRNKVEAIVEAIVENGDAKASTKWAYVLMEREAGGERVDCMAAQFWREAFGYPKDQDAKQALEAIKKSQVAA